MTELLHDPATYLTGKLDAKPPHAMLHDFVDFERVYAETPPPANVINSSVAANVGAPFAIALAMYLNNLYGCCTCSAIGNILRVDSDGAFQIADQDVEDTYEAVTAEEGAEFNPGPPPVNDNGCAELDVLDYWVTDGVGGDKLLGHAGVDYTNPDEIRAALFLCGPLNPGWQLSTDQQTQEIWEPGPAAPGSWGGHDAPLSDWWTEIPSGLIVPGAGWPSVEIPTDLGGVGVVLTWGGYKPISPSYVPFACDELHALITDKWIARNANNPAVNLSALQTYLATLQPESTTEPS